MSQLLCPSSLPLNGTTLIEASAGTGKTFTIANLYVRLVLGHGRDGAAHERALLPREILVVTFTNAATEELRDRIRRRLNDAAAVFRDEIPRSAQLDDLFVLREDYAAEQWLAQARRLQLAAASMDEAAVHTIHGWCQRMLRQHAFESGNVFELELEEDETELYGEAARDYWRIFAYPLDGAAYAEFTALVDAPDTLAQQLHELLRVLPDDEPAPDGSWLKALSDEANHRLETLAAVRAAWLADHPRTLAWCRQAREQGWLDARTHNDSWFATLDAMAAWAAGEAELDEKQLCRLAAANLKLNKAAPERPMLSGLQALDALLAAREAATDFRPDLLRHAAGWCRDHMQRSKLRRGKMGFDDLLLRLDRALTEASGAALAAVIRQQFPVALVDEFQDTDPNQYRILDAIYGQPGPWALVMIGDPKQSIYSFRRADIYSYLQARESTEARYHLGTNYRSATGLVAAVNHLFERAEDYPQGAFLHGSQMPYHTVAAKGRPESLRVDGEAICPLQLWHPDEPVALKADQARDQLARATAAEIVRLLSLAATGRLGFEQADGRLTPLLPADIAVLVRNRHEAAAVREALSEVGLSSAYLSESDSVYASSEARDVLTCLQAVAQPERERLVRSALATELLDQPLASLDVLADEDRIWEARFEQFRRYRAVWRQRGVLPMLRMLLHEHDVPARMLSRAGGERALTNALHIAELLQQASGGMDGEPALLRYLAARVDDPRLDTGEETPMRLEREDDLIRVTSVHKAKGLEYPLVFLPFACFARKVTASNQNFLVYHRDGRQVIDFAPTNESCDRADAERLAEDLRLLYVALTRARHACWVGTMSLKMSRVHDSALGYLLRGGKAISAADLPAALQALADGSPHIAVGPLPQAPEEVYQSDGCAPASGRARPAPQLQIKPWWIASYSAIGRASLADEDNAALRSAGPLHAEDAAEEAVGRELRDELNDDRAAGAHDIHSFARGPRAGTFLHELLEWCGQQGYAAALGDPLRLHAEIRRRCERRGWGAWAEALTDWMKSLLTRPLELPAGGRLSLADLPATAAIPELEFLVATHDAPIRDIDAAICRYLLPGRARPPLRAGLLNGMLRGFIDLVFEHQGRYYVVDFKSNHLGPGAASYHAGALDAAVLAHRYDLQYVFYTLALHRLLRSRLSDYDYDRHIGGVVYLFLRGVHHPSGGQHAQRLPRALIEVLDATIAADPVRA